MSNPQSSARLAAFRRFAIRLSQSRFFMVSLAIHFVVVLLLGGVVLIKNVAPRSEFDDATGGSASAPLNASAPDPALQALQDAVQPVSNTSAAVATNAVPALAPILSASTLPSDFSLPNAPLVPPPTGQTTRTLTESAAAPASAPATRFSGIPRDIAKGMVNFQQGTGAPAGERGSGINKSRAFQFTAYVARYGVGQRNGGDWDSTTHFRNGKCTGALPNLLFLINKWSSDKIKATPDPTPLDIASDALFRVKPPFIMFTGHKDFTLTQKEVENLRQYLQLGGAIWGDSSLPGRRSRFDLAFRREMKKVVGESADFEPLPRDHPIFTRAYFPELRDVPPGLNYFREAVYAMQLYGEIAVLYTANDYGDMWQIGLTEQGQIDESRDERKHLVNVNQALFDNRDVYFRNLEPKPLSDSYKFGTNIIVHLLTRWEEKLRNVPTGL
ncbi:MAG: DUF4159 domain-containing protein [Verrucomicrobia bacterium]|nr:DUF4159 domain-containing protein [Verrucomicrobiota bacterium]